MSWPSSSARTKNWGTEILTDSDQEAQLDLLHTYINDMMNASTGHAHTGGTADGPKITLTTGVQGTLPLANGGTGQTTLAGLLNLVYPVGSVYINVSDSTNPETLLGFGTWTAFAEGRVLVGLDSGQTEFDTIGETGGAKTHTLSIAEMPSHDHEQTNNQGGTGVPFSTQMQANGHRDLSGSTTGSTGGGGAHNNLQPYIVVYMWKRTA